MRIGTVVVGDDGSLAGSAALNWAHRHATGEIHVVRAVSPGMELLAAGFQIETDLRRADEDIHAAVDALDGSTEEICTHVVEDDVPNALLDVARRHDADAIVVGSNGHERFGDLVGVNLGRLLHLSELPVLVVPEATLDADGVPLEPPDERSSGELVPIVVGVSGDDAVDRGLVSWTRGVAPETPLVLLHAVSPAVLSVVANGADAEIIRERVHERLDQIAADGVATDTAVVFDHPVDALAEASADAALVVVGSHRSSRMVGFVTGSIAQHLPAIVHCPVALVPLDVSV